MSEVETQHPFAVKGEDGVVYGGAADAAGATVIAGSLFLAAVNYSPFFTVVESGTGAVVAAIGRPTEGPPGPPVITSLEPAQVTFPGEDVTLRVLGEGFDEMSVIRINEGNEATTFVSENELTTGIDVSTIQVATVVPVVVRNADNQISEPANLAYVPGEEVEVEA